MLNFGVTQSRQGPAMARAAIAMLRALGGREVRLRLGVAGGADSTQASLGTAASVQDVSLSPVLARAIAAKAGEDTMRFELLMAVMTLEEEANDQGQSAEQFLANVVGAVYPFVYFGGTSEAEQLLRVESVECVTFGVAPCVYRMVVSK